MKGFRKKPFFSFLLLSHRHPSLFPPCISSLPVSIHCLSPTHFHRRLSPSHFHRRPSPAHFHRCPPVATQPATQSFSPPVHCCSADSGHSSPPVVGRSTANTALFAQPPIDPLHAQPLVAAQPPIARCHDHRLLLLCINRQPSSASITTRSISPLSRHLLNRSCRCCSSTSVVVLQHYSMDLPTPQSLKTSTAISPLHQSPTVLYLNLRPFNCSSPLPLAQPA